MRMKKKKARPILKRILIPMILLTLMDVILLSGSFIYGGTIQELNQNAHGIVKGKVENRSSYIENCRLPAKTATCAIFGGHPGT